MFRPCSAVLCSAFCFACASGQVITVNTSSDVIDFGGARQVGDLPGPDGRVSLQEAGLASDNTPGVQTIAFEVPQSEWLYQWAYPGRVVLRPFLGFRVFDSVIIDATTQTAFSRDTNPDGAEVVIWAEFYLNDNVGGEVRGLDSSSINVAGGSDNIIQANTNTSISVYDSPRCLIGGTGAGQGNTGGTIKIDRASYNTIVGNTVQRVRILGWVGGDQPAVGNRVGGSSPGERNYITGYGTWSGEGFPGGTTVQIFDSVGTIVEGNWIGTTPDGMSQGSLASTQGIGFEGENHDVVIRNNLIAGILGHGQAPHYQGVVVGRAIHLYGLGSGFVIQGNTIGLNALGQPLLGSVTGIETDDYIQQGLENVLIGGSDPGEGNQIAGHRLEGVRVLPQFGGLRISGNSIHDNGTLGIDLLGPLFETGVSLNDPLDADAGGNGQQNFPVLSLAESSGTGVHVAGTLDSSPNGEFSVEFFASSNRDASGHGEGEVFLGAVAIVTDAGGHAGFDVTLRASVPEGWYATATATLEPVGSTSEFGACLAFVRGGCPADFIGVGQADFFDYLDFVQAFDGQDAAADFNADGQVDFFDYLDFVAAFASGC